MSTDQTAIVPVNIINYDNAFFLCMDTSNKDICIVCISVSAMATVYLMKPVLGFCGFSFLYM